MNKTLKIAAIPFQVIGHIVCCVFAIIAVCVIWPFDRELRCLDDLSRVPAHVRERAAADKKENGAP